MPVPRGIVFRRNGRYRRVAAGAGGLIGGREDHRRMGNGTVQRGVIGENNVFKKRNL